MPKKGQKYTDEELTKFKSIEKQKKTKKRKVFLEASGKQSLSEFRKKELAKIAREKLKKGQPIKSFKREELKKGGPKPILTSKPTRNKDGSVRKNTKKPTRNKDGSIRKNSKF